MLKNKSAVLEQSLKT